MLNSVSGISRNQTSFGCSRCELGKKTIKLLVENGADAIKAAKTIESRAPKRGCMDSIDNKFLTHEHLTQRYYNIVAKDPKIQAGNVNSTSFIKFK